MFTSGLTLEQAAYLMGKSVKKVKKMIEKGELLTIAGTTLIHESEMVRFQHPWKRIFELDQRITAQQNLVETLKSRVVEQTGHLRSLIVPEVDDMHEEIREFCSEISGAIKGLQDAIVSIQDNKADKLFKRGKKNAKKADPKSKISLSKVRGED